MRIPEVQKKLRELAREKRMPILAKLADELTRRKPQRRGKNLSVPMTDAMRKKIIRMHQSNPDLPYGRIAAALNINGGRVSETLSGFRK